MRTFIKSDYTFLNERLAKHYGIPDVYGSRFRRVTLAPESKRGGLLRQGSVLSVTSYATRTSPVLRGVLVLRNILGAPPPPPPPNVPALDESTMAANLPMRQRLAAHRSNAVCASCHRTIDPVGFALENFDAVGQWRDLEVDEQPVDASGALPGGGEFRGIDGLEDALLAPSRTVCRNSDGEPSDVRARTRRRVLRCACRSQDCERRREGRIPVLVAHSRNREERSVSNAAR